MFDFVRIDGKLYNRLKFADGSMITIPVRQWTEEERKIVYAVLEKRLDDNL